MRIEEAIRAMRKGNICRCKRRYYAIRENCLFLLHKKDKTDKYVWICGVANLNGQDFATEEWEVMKDFILIEKF